MLIGYMRVSKADGSQATDLQRDALIAAKVDPAHLYEDQASGKREDRPGLVSCLKALREGDTLVVWKLDRLGRDLRHLINTVHDLTGRGVGLKVLTGHGAAIDTAMAAMGQPETKVGDLCQELGITRQTLYRHISPKGELRPDGMKLISRNA
jgi:DNA invertase Pin-like site-specific DNA recombinase